MEQISGVQKDALLSMKSIQVTNPGAIATSNRRKKLKVTYASEDWLRACDEVLNRGHIKIKGIIRGEGLQVGEAGMLVGESVALLLAKVPCEWHLNKAGQVVQVGTLFHHSYLESYKDGTYINLKSVGGKILCGGCHYAIHNDLDLCKCGKYMRRGAEVCRACFDKAHPEIRAENNRRIAESKALQKRLRDEEKARVKQWKLDNPKSATRNPKPGQLIPRTA
jgi:hypothetical protein